MLEEENKIKLRFKVNFQTWLSLITNNKYILYLAKKWHWKTYNWVAPLEGYAVIRGQNKYFCIDIYDDPYGFNSELLSKVDVYFKMQYPQKIKPDGFALTDEVRLPWGCNNLFENLHKIKPLMVGPRRLTYGNKHKSLKVAYENYLNSRHVEKTGKLMAYFGTDTTPLGIECSEDDAKKIVHPNHKRGIAVSVIRKMGEKYDARVITENGITHNELVIPLSSFCHHIAQFEYNLNISGIGLSIPNRFIESFMAGTAILTDKLHVKWYLPFDEEVQETVEMGYYLNEKINWEQFEKDITNLPTVRKDKILEHFRNKWSPLSVAEYILSTLEAE
jgi:hypothetical protein